MSSSILDQLTSRFYSTDNYENDTKPLKYITAANGNFEIRQSQIGTFTSKIDKIPNLKEIDEEIKLSIPKISFDIFTKMIAWFREVYKEDGTEATFMVFYDENEGEFIPFIPKQENTGTNSHYLRDEDEEYKTMAEEKILVMVAHSHPWKGSSRPSPSGTDNSDEKEAILYLIANNVEEIPNVYCSTCPGGNRVTVDFFDIFENPFLSREDIPEDIKELLKPNLTEKFVFEKYLDVESFEIPKEWSSRASKKTYSRVQPKKVASGYDSWYDNYDKYDLGYYGYGRSYKTSKKKTKKKSVRDQIEDYYKKLNKEDSYEDSDMQAAITNELLDQALDLDYDSKIGLILSILEETDEGLAETLSICIDSYEEFNGEELDE